MIPIDGPLERVRVAVRDAESKGIRILHVDWGVLHGELSGQWVVDERKRPRGVTPLGAVLLHFQPERDSNVTDYIGDAATALGTRVAWADGFADGFDNEASGIYLGSVDRKLYLAGMEAGLELRLELTVRCRTCSSRHFRCDPCPLCEERRRWSSDEDAA